MVKIKSAEINNYFEKFLNIDEKIIWSGHPCRKIIFTGMDILLVPITVIWSSMILYWEINFFCNDLLVDFSIPSLIIALFGSVFIYFSYFLTIGRFLYKFKKSNNTYYAITNQRAIILERYKKEKFETRIMKNVKVVDKVVRKNGIGSIGFGEITFLNDLIFRTGLDKKLLIWNRKWLLWNQKMFLSGDNELSLVFNDIENVNEVYSLIKSCLSTSK